jgi:hypothetical protein
MTNVTRIEPAHTIHKTEPAKTLLPAHTVGALTLKASAEYLSISEISVRRLRRRGLLRPVRGLKKLTFSIRELNRYLEET